VVIPEVLDGDYDRYRQEYPSMKKTIKMQAGKGIGRKWRAAGVVYIPVG
jgi:hypothetical protein